MDSPSASLRIDSGIPKVKRRPNHLRLTPTAIFDGNGYANRKLLFLSTTINRYLFSSYDSYLRCWISYSILLRCRRSFNVSIGLDEASCPEAGGPRPG